MKTVVFGGLTARLLGGTDGDGAGDGPLVVLCHGFGAPGDDLVSIGQALVRVPELAAAGTRFLFPHAPLDLGPQYGGGRAWWPVDMMKRQLAMMRGETDVFTRESPPGIEKARDALNALLDRAETELGVTADRIVLGGFSQGSMISTDIVLRGDRKLLGLAILSGTLLAESEWTPLMAARRGLPVFMSHGSSDPVLPFATAERLYQLFVENGLAVRWVPFRGGHGIPEDVILGLATFLGDLVGKK